MPGERFEVIIELGNDTMQDGRDVAEALRVVAQTIEMRLPDNLRRSSSRIYDRNGNTVGHWRTRGRK